MCNSRDDFEITDRMLSAGVNEFACVTDMGADVAEVTPEDLRAVYIAMRRLEGSRPTPPQYESVEVGLG